MIMFTRFSRHTPRGLARLAWALALLACNACSPGSLPGSPNPITVGGGGGRYDGTLTYRRLGGVFNINENAQSLSMSLQLAAEDQFNARFDTSAGSHGSLQGILAPGGTLTSSAFRATLLVSVPATSTGGTSTCEGRGDATGTFSGTQVTWTTGAISYDNCAGLSTAQQASATATSPIPAQPTAAAVIVAVSPSTRIVQQSTCADGLAGFAFVVEFRETSGLSVDLDDRVTVEERRSNQTVIRTTSENPVRTLAGGERRTFAACGHEPGSYQVFFSGHDQNNNAIRFASPVVTFGNFTVS